MDRVQTISNRYFTKGPDLGGDPILVLFQFPAHQPSHGRGSLDRRMGVQEQAPGATGQNILDRARHLMTRRSDHLNLA